MTSLPSDRFSWGRVPCSSSPLRIVPAEGIPDFPDCGQSGPRIAVPGRIGKRGISRIPIPTEPIGNRKFPPRFPAPAKSGIGGTVPSHWGFPDLCNMTL